MLRKPRSELWRNNPRIVHANIGSEDLLRKPQIHTQSSRIAQPNPGHPRQQTHDRLRKRSSSAIHRNEATTDRARKAVRPSAAKSHERSHSKAAHPSAATKHNRSRSRAHTLRLCRQRWLTIVGSLPRMAELLVNSVTLASALRNATLGRHAGSSVVL